MATYLFTSESVTPGHPDKVADQISDAILDELIKQDPDTRTGVETLTTTGLIIVAGEVKTRGYVDVQSVVRNTVREVGYNKAHVEGEGNIVGDKYFIVFWRQD